jgi:hypothetical protein
MCNRDVVKYKGSYQMEDVSAALLGLLVPIFWPYKDPKTGQVLQMLPDPHILEAWGCLVQIAKFHLTPQKFSSQAELEAAADENYKQYMLRYGVLCEQVGGVQGVYTGRQRPSMLELLQQHKSKGITLVVAVTKEAAMKAIQQHHWSHKMFVCCLFTPKKVGFRISNQHQQSLPTSPQHMLRDSDWYTHVFDVTAGL